MRKKPYKLTPANTKKKAPKSKGGRPSKYKSINREQVTKLAYLGATNDDIADFFNVSIATLKNYMKKREFLTAVKKGKDISDAEVVKSLYKRALGYEITETVYEPGRQGKRIKLKETVKYVHPDTVACIFWLKNRQPGAWRDKKEIHAEGLTLIVGESRELKDVKP